MQIPSSIKELFLPLAERLYYYESKEYINAPRTFFDLEGEHSYDSESLIKGLVTLVNLFQPEEVLDEASIYAERINQMIGQLQFSKSELRIDIHHGVSNVLKLNDEVGDEDFANDIVKEERRQSLFERHREELVNYISGLQIMIEAAQHQLQLTQKTQSAPEAVNDTKIYFQLPDKLGVKNFKGHFQPLLSEKQAALLLHYLRDSELIPNYSKTDLSRLAMLLFIRNQQNIRAGLSEINDLKLEEGDLKSLISILQSVIDNIRQELPKSKQKL